MRLRSLTVTVPVLFLAACASPSAPAGGPEARSPYGLFLAGQAALNDGESRQAADYFERATRSDETPGLISERAFTAAVLSGEIEKAAAMAPMGDEASEGAKRLGRLVLAVDALAAGRGDAAYRLLTSEEIGFPHRTAAALLTPWAAAQAGDMDLATRRPDVPGDKLVEYFGMLGQAHQYERVRRYDEAETDFKALTEGSDAPPMLVLAYGEFLERRGRRADAVALYDRALATYRRDVALSLARERASA
ncbi:MAG: hypothetical protein KXJ53_13950, partial [Phenylobacterium sp.]|nr:hypothetical protein [Phenylobacterium sp.]